MGVLAIYGYGLVAAAGDNARPLNQVIQSVCFTIHLRTSFNLEK